MSNWKVMVDFETRCHLDVTKVGAYNYARHPSCTVLMASYNIAKRNSKFDPANTKLWQFTDPPPKALLDAIEGGAQLVAWNSFFEYCIWSFVCTPKLGWPVLHHKDTRDPSAKARAMALPASLAGCSAALHLPVQKDKEGKRLIRKFSPAPSAKYRKTPDLWVLPADRPDWEAFCEYCITDTNVQCNIDNLLPSLNEKQIRIAHLIDRMNLRGIYIDVTAVKAADKLTQQVREKYNTLASKLAGGAFEKCTQRAKVKKWLKDTQGVALPNMQGDTVNVWLRKKDLPEDARKMLEYYKIAGSTGASKFASMLTYINPITQRVHELLAYHRARTGRLGGRGIQIQNLPRPTLPKGTDYDAVIQLIKMGCIDKLEGWAAFNKVTPMEVLSSAIRSVITAMVGNIFLSADYSAIEARLAFWLSGQLDALQVIREGGDIYLDMGAVIYGVPFEGLTKESKERVLGKEAVLGCGYGVGGEKFETRVWEVAGIRLADLNLSGKDIVDKYRSKYKFIPLEWKELNEQAVLTVKLGITKTNVTGMRSVIAQARAERMKGIKRGFRKHQEAIENKPRIMMWVEYINDKKYLVIRKPSGEKLWYPDAHLVKVEKFGRVKDELRYAAMDSYTHKWNPETKTYGGKLFENLTQGTAADLINDALLKLEELHFPPIMQVHDEMVTEVLYINDEEAKLDLQALEGIMCEKPDWEKFSDFPLGSEGWIGQRYRK